MGAGQDPQLLLHHRNAQRRVGRDLPCQAQSDRLQLDDLELGGLVAAAVEPGRIETLRLEQGIGPSLPSWIDLLGLGQPQEMTLGWQDLSVAVADRGPDVARLTAFLGDDHGLHRRVDLSSSATAAYRTKTDGAHSPRPIGVDSGAPPTFHFRRAGDHLSATRRAQSAALQKVAAPRCRVPLGLVAHSPPCWSAAAAPPRA